MNGDPKPARPAAPAAGGIGAIATLLACPACRGSLDVRADGIRCLGCRACYGLDDGIALLAVRGGPESWGAPAPAATSEAYQSEYQTVERASGYRDVYTRHAHKRFGTRHEWRLVRRHLDRVGRAGVVLELPCGGGRITPAIADRADFIVGADIAIGQVRFARANSSAPTPCAWMTASAFHIPLGDASVDGVVCIRLAHHLPTAAERERLFRELLRVSRRFVIATFYDGRSLKNLTRRLRHPFRPKPVKPAMTVAQVEALAREAGARLVAAPPLNRVVSGHRFALIVKDGEAV
jgi:SAM-dependent methyltransferase